MFFRGISRPSCITEQYRWGKPCDVTFAKSSTSERYSRSVCRWTLFLMNPTRDWNDNFSYSPKTICATIIFLHWHTSDNLRSSVTMLSLSRLGLISNLQRWVKSIFIGKIISNFNCFSFIENDARRDEPLGYAPTNLIVDFLLKSDIFMWSITQPIVFMEDGFEAYLHGVNEDFLHPIRILERVRFL